MIWAFAEVIALQPFPLNAMERLKLYVPACVNDGGVYVAVVAPLIAVLFEPETVFH